MRIIYTKGTENTRVFGRPFVTAGWTVILTTAIAAATELTLLFLILV
jgi:hypothetical protein